MATIVPQKTTFRPIRAENLPNEIRGAFSDETIVRVSVEALTDKNGLTPEQSESLREAIREYETEGDTLKPYRDAEELIADLRAGR